MPTTTTGVATSFIDFTRASNATVTDSDGKVKWAPHNLLTNSESFDAASWSKYLAPITANAQVAPNGTTTADTVTTSDNNSGLYRSLTVLSGASYTLAFWAKRGTMTDAKLYVVDATNSADIIPVTSYYASINSSTWTLVTQTFTVPSNCVDITFYLLRASLSTGTIHFWGAALYRSDLGGMQPNTSAYPMYNPTTPKNLLGYTELFSDSWWTKANTTATITSTPGPLGNGYATLVYPTSTGADRGVWRSSGVSGSTSTPYTISIYAKANGKNFINFFSLAAAGNINGVAVFDLQNGIRTQVGSYFTSASITPVGNGWYRCTATATSAASTLYTFVGIVDATLTATVTASGTDGVLLWGAQLSDSASLDPYVPNYGAAVTSAAYYGPRRDFDGATLACKGLLVEEQRTNLQLNSNVFGTSTFAATVVAGAAASPSGLIDASSLACTSVGGRAILSMSVTSGIVYTFSAFIKAGTNTSAFIELAGTAGSGGAVVFNLSSGTVTSGTGGAIVPAPNGFYRCSVTSTATGTGASDMRIGTGDATSKTVFVYGAQLEANASFATSYIPTGAATATRNADVASVSTQAFPYSSTEGTMVLNASVLSTASGNRAGATLYQSSTASITVGNNVGGGGPTTADFYVVNSGSDQAWFYFNSAVTAGSAFKVGGFFKANNFNGAANGVAGTLDTTGTVPNAVDEMRIGRGAGGGGTYLNGHIRQITYLPRAVTTAELQTRTA